MPADAETADVETIAGATGMPVVVPAVSPIDPVQLLGSWPGPALLLTMDGETLAVNTRAEMLCTLDPHWALDLQRWVAAGGPQVEPCRSLPVHTQHGPGVIEFTVAPLPAALVLCLGRDATLERRLRQALTESRQRYKDLVDISSDFAWEVGSDGRFAFVSPAGAIGYSADELVGRDPADLVLPEFQDQPLPFQTRDPVGRAEVWLRAKDGSAACLISSAVPLLGPYGEWRGARGACRNITEARLKGMELARARLREQYLGYIVSSTRDDVDPSRTLEIAAGVAANATGADGGRLFIRKGPEFQVVAGMGDMPVALEAQLPQLIQGLPDQRLATLSSLDGMSLVACHTLFQHEINGAILVWRRDPFTAEDGGMVQAIADHVGVVVAQARYQERLKALSERDELTGLLNRRAFLEALGERLGRKTGGSSALLYFDLDNFKAVNDTQGHTAGDSILHAVGTLLGRLARSGDMAGRLGGDEFVLWVDRVTEAQALAVADRLLREAGELLHPMSAAPDLPLGISIGIALHRGGAGESWQRLVDRADQAMYAAKRQGKGHRALAPDPTGAIP